MKYIKQFAIIITFSFAGEVLRALLPLPVPASIYGLVLMLLGLVLHIIPLDSVKDTGKISGGSNAADVYSGCRRADGILGQDQSYFLEADHRDCRFDGTCHGHFRPCYAVCDQT